MSASGFPKALDPENAVDTAAPDRHAGEVERFVNVSASTRLWAQETGEGGTSPLLLIMGANASGMAWPDALVRTLAEHHRVIRYDHRDTGRSSWSL